MIESSKSQKLKALAKWCNWVKGYSSVTQTIDKMSNNLIWTNEAFSGVTESMNDGNKSCIIKAIIYENDTGNTIAYQIFWGEDSGQ